MFKKIKEWYWIRQVNKGMAVLRSLEIKMKKAGYNRHRRKQFWRSFIREEDFRKNIFREIKK